MAKNELLPVLDVVLETYLTGLQGDYNIGQSFADQFSRGEPSYTAGLIFEVPLYNRAARARYHRRQLELQQLSSQFQAAVEQLKAELEVAVREVHTAFREMQSEYHAMVAAKDDVSFLTRRWELLPGEDRAASFALEDLLDSQDRLMAEEFGFVQTQIEYTLSLARLRRATGTLLQQEHLVPEAGAPEEVFTPAVAPENQ
jgi:outer membrane protein TolC